MQTIESKILSLWLYHEENTPSHVIQSEVSKLCRLHAYNYSDAEYFESQSQDFKILIKSIVQDSQKVWTSNE